MKRIHVISPVTETDALQPMVRDMFALAQDDKGIEISHAFLNAGPTCIENHVDRATAAVQLTRQALAAEADGVDGVIINCMADPGLFAVREALKTPVIALSETAMHMAAMLGQRFGLIDVVETTRAMAGDQAARYGLHSRFGSFRAISVPVLEIESDPAVTADKLTEAGRKAVTEDHVDVLILGCGTLLGPGLLMTKRLADEGIDVPVINPLPLAINVMAALVRSNLRHSKQAYPLPGARSFKQIIK